MSSDAGARPEQAAAASRQATSSSLRAVSFSRKAKRFPVVFKQSAAVCSPEGGARRHHELIPTCAHTHVTLYTLPCPPPRQLQHAAAHLSPGCCSGRPRCPWWPAGRAASCRCPAAPQSRSARRRPATPAAARRLAAAARPTTALAGASRPPQRGARTPPPAHVQVRQGQGGQTPCGACAAGRCCRCPRSSNCAARNGAKAADGCARPAGRRSRRRCT
jgi:hypothetical protein